MKKPKLILLLAVILVALYSGFSHFSESTERLETAKAIACSSNIMNIGAQLELYVAKEMNEKYPESLEVAFQVNGLREEEIKALTTCPSAQKNTYEYFFSVESQSYSIFCAGNFHADAGYKIDRPYFSSENGKAKNKQISGEPNSVIE